MTQQETTSPHCPALCPSGAKGETLIPCGEAKERYDVCVRHGKMPTNGELRFRLNCLDGSAYIRTQTTGESQGWQKPHYHKQLKETYIVEKGLIGYAELKDGSPVYRKYGLGRVFTTQPNLAHNIYMFPDSVIHTVKHNGGTVREDGQADWWSNDDCELLASLIGSSFPTNVPTEEIQTIKAEQHHELSYYSADYRHFDTLIWQVPTWSSALFTAIVVSVNSFVVSNTTNTLATLFDLSANVIAAIPIGLLGVFTLVLSYALHRFRWHQFGVKTWSRNRVVTPQSLLQLVVCVEAGLLLLVAGRLLDMPISAVVVALLLVIGYLFCYWENSLKIRARKFNPQKQKKTDIAEESDVHAGSS